MYISIENFLDGLQNHSVCGGRREKCECPNQKSLILVDFTELSQLSNSEVHS
jgi:hypothetical protein